MDVDEFGTGVLVPLATLGTIVVRGPIDADDVRALVADRHSIPGIAELGVARERMLARFLYSTSPPDLDEDAIKLAAAVHNLCYLLGQDRLDQKGTLHRVALYTCKLAQLPPPADESALIARHALVGNMRALARRDTGLRFWAGQRDFRGEEPPKRLLKWQSVRRVRVEHTTVQLFTEALANPATRPIVTALLGSSPLTDLLTIDRAEPPVDLRTSARWLRSARIARPLADEYLRRGLAAIEPPLMTALMALYNQKDAADAAATATRFHSHLHLLDVIARPARDREGHLQVLRGYVQGRDRVVSDGFGLHAAADRVGLGRPADIARDPQLQKNVDAYAEACAKLVGQRRLSELMGLLARGAGPHARVA